MNDSLPQLPEFDPRPDLWARIEADLNADEQLSRVVQDLPEFAPKADLWATIEQTLPSENAGQHSSAMAAAPNPATLGRSGGCRYAGISRRLAVSAARTNGDSTCGIRR